FMLGAYLVLYPLPKKLLPWLGVLAIIGYLTTVWGTNYLTEQQGELDEFFYEHYRPNALFITLFLFEGFNKLGPKLKPNYFVTRISSATFGIYIIHPLVQLYLKKVLGIHETMFNPLFAVPISWIIIFLLSFGIIIVLQKIPYLNKIVP